MEEEGEGGKLHLNESRRWRQSASCQKVHVEKLPLEGSVEDVLVLVVWKLFLSVCHMCVIEEKEPR